MFVKRVKGFLKRIFFVLVLFPILLSGIVTLFLACPPVQKYVNTRLSAYLSNTFDTEVRISRVYFNVFSRRINLAGILVEDQNKDTLVSLGNLDLKVRFFNFANNSFDFDELNVDSVYVRMVRDSSLAFNYDFLVPKKDSSYRDTAKSATEYNISVASLNLTNINFAYSLKPDDPLDSVAMDFENIWLSDINLAAHDIVVGNENLRAVAFIDSLSAREHCGFVLQKLAGNVDFSTNGIFIDNLQLVCPNTDVKAKYLNFVYSGIDDFSHFLDSVKIQASLSNGSMLGLDDLAHFVPNVAGYGIGVNVSGDVDGTVSNLKLSDFDVRYGSATRLYTDVWLKGLPDVSNLSFNVSINRLSSNYDDLVSLHEPYDTIALISLPEMLADIGTFNLMATALGSTKNCRVKLDLESLMGDVLGDVSLNKNGNNFQLKGTVNADGLNLGILSGDTYTLGVLSTHESIDAVFRSDGYVSGTISGKVDSVGVMQYYYHDIDINGSFTSTSFNGMLSVKDPCLDLDFEGIVDIASPNKYNFDLQVAHADLHTTNILADTIDNISFALEADFSGNSLDNINGVVQLSEPLVFQRNSKILRLNQFSLVAFVDQYFCGIPSRQIKIYSDYVDAQLSGRVLSSQIGDILSNFAYMIFPSLNYDGRTLFARSKKPSFSRKHISFDDPNFLKYLGNRFDFNIALKNSNKLTDFFMPELYVSNNTVIEGGFNTLRRNSWVSLRTDRISYNGYSADSLTLISHAIKKTFDFNLHCDSVVVTDGFVVKSPDINIHAASDTARFALSWDNSDSLQKNEGVVRGDFVMSPHQIQGHFPLMTTRLMESDCWVFGNKWTFDDCRVVIDSTSIAVDNFVVRNGLQLLAANGVISESREDKFDLELQDFDLSILDKFLGNTTVGGHITGRTSVSSIYESLPLVEVSAKVDTLRVNEVNVGAFTADIDFQPTDSMLVVDFYTLSKMNKKNLHGYGNVDLRNSEIDFSFDIGNLSSRVLRPLFDNYLTVPSTQFLDGITRIKGKFDNLVVMSDLKLKGGYFKIDYLGVKYTIQDALNIVVDNNIIKLEKVKLISGKTGVAYLEGIIHHHNFDDFKMDMNLQLKNFTLLNTVETDSSAFWGKVFASGKVNITGDPTHMINIDAKVSTDKNTQIFLPLYVASEVNSDMNFITFYNPADTLGESLHRQHADLSDIRMNFNINVTSDAEVVAILDAAATNVLRASASGSLKLDITSSGDFNMYGTLAMERGSYLFSMSNVLSKKFEVVKGGTLRWNGNPLDAIVDLTTMYRLRKVNLYNLMVDENYRERKVPVQCLLKMKGNLMTPEISFGVKVEDNSDVVQGQLDNLDEGNINKQMISLLLLNQFQPLPGLRSSESSLFSDINPGELVSNKINHWLSDITDKVDVGVNYQKGDASSSDELDVAVSTQLFDDRVSVTTNLGVGGESTSQRPEQRNTNNVVGEVEVDVKLNKTGSMTLNVFNKANDDELSESHYKQGVGLTYRREFNSLNELWHSMVKIFTPRRKRKE